jgi:DNA (cytosine-5)-methyltransferase 1
MIRVGSDFSGVGAFNQALNRLGIEYKEIFACDMDKYARQTFIHNYGEPDYYPTNVYDREIPKESLDIYMTSPPCQAFSSAGRRLGKDDLRGILFFNSYEFIKVNKPRYFIFENVKGLLSDDGGKTFSEWVNMLGGKSVNYVPVIFPYEESVPYHLYWQVLNAKEHGVPQNRERVFLVGIRDDEDNSFRFPKEEHLIKRLKDILEDDVEEKYYLSDSQYIGIKRLYQTLKKNKLPNKEVIIDSYNQSIHEESICISTRINASSCTHLWDTKLIRRLTPRECFRLMDFPDSFTWPVSDSQAYKQAGNSIVVNVLYKILKNLNLDATL